MKPAYQFALITGALGLAAVGWAVLAGPEPPVTALLVAAAAAPTAVLAAVWGRLNVRFPVPSLIGGALIGPLFALLSQPLVAGFAVAFILGFADSGRKLLESLRADPSVVTLLASPWVLLTLIELAVVVPPCEELGKALGAALFRPANRREAFVSGVAAGVGFAVIENILYASLGGTFGGPWPAIALARSMGAAVHALASGLVVMGWWEARQTRRALPAVRGFLAGAGVHALWNGSLVVVGVVETAIRQSPTWRPLGPVSLAYAAVLGVVLAAALWRVTVSVAADEEPFAGVNFAFARPLAAWTVLAASLLLPIVALLLAFPGFYRG